MLIFPPPFLCSAITLYVALLLGSLEPCWVSVGNGALLELLFINQLTSKQRLLGAVGGELSSPSYHNISKSHFVKGKTRQKDFHSAPMPVEKEGGGMQMDSQLMRTVSRLPNHGCNHSPQGAASQHASSMLLAILSR